jgi:CRISPR-associated protein Csy2
MENKVYSAAVTLPHLYLHNANAVSSHMTWGFPAMTAFTGFMHALQRKLQAAGVRVWLDGIGVVCHDAQHMVANGPAYAPKAFRLTRNPVDKSGETAAIVEEGRMHATVSLVMTVRGEDVPHVAGIEAQTFADDLMETALAMRLAGASIGRPHGLASRRARLWVWNSDSQEKVQKRLLRSLLPGFTLISRAPLLASHLKKMRVSNSSATALDALLDLCAVHHSAEQADTNGKATWTAKKREKGYLVPIPLGYAAIDTLHGPQSARGARDPDMPFRFVESVVSMGEWRAPHRLQQLEDMVWRFDARPEAGVYLVANSQTNNINEQEKEHG